MELNELLKSGMDDQHADVRARPTFLEDVLVGARRRRRRTRGALAAAASLATVAAVVGLVGTQQGSETPAESLVAGPTTTPMVVRETVPYDAATAPEVFRKREPLPSCGDYVLGLGLGEQLPPAASACLLAEGSAELAVSRLTIEGDPIVAYYRADPGPVLDVFIDATRDSFGSGTWVRKTCTGFDPARGRPTGCTEAQTISPVPVTPRARALIEDLRAFADSPDAATFASLRLAPQVRLGLGTELLRAVPAAELRDPSAWVLDVPSYAAQTGPFDILQVLRDAESYKVAIGPHSHCASPPRPAPEAVADLPRISTQPVVESCLDWSTVDLFVRGDGRIEAITLDLWAT